MGTQREREREREREAKNAMVDWWSCPRQRTGAIGRHPPPRLLQMPYCFGACGTAPRPQTGPRDRVVTGHTGRPLSYVCVCAASLFSSLVSLSSSSSSFSSSSSSSSCFFFFLTRKERTSVFTDLVLQAFFLFSQNSDNNDNIFVLAASSSSSICYLPLHSCCLFACKSVLGVILQSWKWFVCLFVILLLVFAPRLPFWFWLARCPFFGGLLWSEAFPGDSLFCFATCCALFVFEIVMFLSCILFCSLCPWDCCVLVLQPVVCSLCLRNREKKSRRWRQQANWITVWSAYSSSNHCRRGYSLQNKCLRTGER